MKISSTALNGTTGSDQGEALRYYVVVLAVPWRQAYQSTSLSVALYGWMHSGALGITVLCCRSLRDGVFGKRLSRRHHSIESGRSLQVLPRRLLRAFETKPPDYVSLTSILG
jgi:hypothetical protein